MTPAAAPLTWTLDDPAAAVRLHGEVDVAILPTLELALEALADRPGDVTVDLVDLSFIDVLGSRSLARTAVRLRSTGRSLRLCGVAPPVGRMLRVLGWTEQFTLPGG